MPCSARSTIENAQWFHCHVDRKCLHSRYFRNPEVQEEFLQVHKRNRSDATKLAMMPIIAKNNRTVQHANLRTIAATSRHSQRTPLRFLQCVVSTPQSGRSLTNSFERKAYSLPASQTSFVDTVLYSILGLPYQCVHSKWLEYVVAKHSCLVL